MDIQIQEIFTLSDICRACLVKTDNMTLLLEPSEEIIQLITKLSSVANLEIVINDALPCFLCQNCEEKVKISFEFQELCQKSHQFILACLSSTSSGAPMAVSTESTMKPVPLEDTIENTNKEIVLEPTFKIDFMKDSNLDKPQQICEENHDYQLKSEKLDNKDTFVQEQQPENKLEHGIDIIFNADELKVEVKEHDTKTEQTCVNNDEKRPDFISGNDAYQSLPNLYHDSTSEAPTADKNECEILNMDSGILNSLNESTISVNGHLVNENFVKPAEVARKTDTNQYMRLPQYAPDEIEKIISQARARFLRNVNCLYCGFTANDTRALSVHMTRLHKELKKQWCSWCNKTYEALTEHMSNEHKDNFKCPLCGKIKNNTGHFMEHLASHSVQRRYACEICNKSFISSRHLRNHLKTHASTKQHVCELCSKQFFSLKTLASHLRIHNKHKCKICEECFGSKPDYEAHVCFIKDIGDENSEENRLDKLLGNMEENMKPQNYCYLCDKKVRSLKLHKGKCHLNKERKPDPSALCPVCGKQFRIKSKLTVHLRIHTGETPYKCTYCDRRMTTREHLVVHERTHTGEKPHICKVCGRGFAQSSVLNTHMKLHTGRPEQCTVCLKRFCRPSELKQHMRRHTGEKPYLCTDCGHSFTQRSHLSEHLKVHTSDRPFKCKYCHKGFKQAGTLKAHTNIHLGNKPFKCSQCPYACRQSYSLNQHMMQHENDQPNYGRPHKCNLCDKYFTTLAMLSSHFGSQHGSLKSFNVDKINPVEITCQLQDESGHEN